MAPNASDASVPQLSAQMASFGARDVLYALKDLAKSLSAIPGRKTVILITGGFPLTPEIISEATAAISACNKANVAIYPIDVRGLVAGTPQAQFEFALCATFVSCRRPMFPAAWRSSSRNTVEAQAVGEVALEVVGAGEDMRAEALEAAAARRGAEDRWLARRRTHERPQHRNGIARKPA